jgi:hypothetical protein
MRVVFSNCFSESAHAVARREIRAVKARLPTIRLDIAHDLPAARLIATVHQHQPTFSGETLGDDTPDAIGRAGDQSDALRLKPPVAKC